MLLGRAFLSIFVDFVRRPGTTRAEGPHGGASYVRGAGRHRIDHSRAHRLLHLPAPFRRYLVSTMKLKARFNVDLANTLPLDPRRCASRAVQFYPHGGQFDSARLPARTMHPHGGASNVR